jgi:hypothetical protein
MMRQIKTPGVAMHESPLHSCSFILLIALCPLIALLLVQCGYIESAFNPVKSTPTTLSGRVVDSMTHVGIAGATVTLDGISEITVQSGENGLFQFNQTTTGSKTMVIRAGGYHERTIPLDLEKRPNAADSILLVRANHPPRITRAIYPTQGLVGAPRILRFSWSFSDTDMFIPSFQEALAYDFFLGLTNPPPLIRSGVLEVGGMKRDPMYTWFVAYIAQEPDTVFANLEADTTYYWKIVVRDVFKDSSVWGVNTFRTRSRFSPDTCPDSMALVERENTAFCMDKYEFANQQFEDIYHDSTIFKIPDSLLRYSMASNTPVIYVRYDTAKAVCEHLGKRLCKIEEWQIALGGYERLRYPYGDVYEPTRCNTEFPMDPEYLFKPTVFPVDSPGTCVSPYGIYDLSGNVSEWVDNVRLTGGQLKPRFDSEGNALEYFLGGNWRSGSLANGDTIFSTPPIDYDSTGKPIHRRADIGFRCCKDLRY